MTTIRHIHRLYEAREYNRLIAHLLTGRVEQMVHWQTDLHGPQAAGALALIRLDELNQPHVPLYSRIVRDLLRLQQSDGGWGGIGITALVLRALLLGQGGGHSVQRGLAYVSSLQKTEGIWPGIPLRRTQADPLISAFLLLQLGHSSAFQSAVNFPLALRWFQNNVEVQDPLVQRLWQSASIRCLVLHERQLPRNDHRLLNVA